MQGLNYLFTVLFSAASFRFRQIPAFSFIAVIFSFSLSFAAWWRFQFVCMSVCLSVPSTEEGPGFESQPHYIFELRHVIV